MGQAAADGELRGQDTGAERPPSASAARSAGRGPTQGEAPPVESLVRDVPGCLACAASPSGSALANPTHTHARAHQRRECHFFGTNHGPSPASPFNSLPQKSSTCSARARCLRRRRFTGLASLGKRYLWCPFRARRKRDSLAFRVSRTLTDVCPAAQTGVPVSRSLSIRRSAHLSPAPSCFNKMLSLPCSSSPTVSRSPASPSCAATKACARIQTTRPSRRPSCHASSRTIRSMAAKPKTGPSWRHRHGQPDRSRGQGGRAAHLVFVRGQPTFVASEHVSRLLT